MRARSYGIKNNQKAFSLIEMLLTFLIVAFLIGFSTKAFRKKERTVKKTFEELSRLNQRLISLSHLRSYHYRLVFDLGLKQPDQYWVEKKKKNLDKSLDQFSSEPENTNEKKPLKELFRRDESFYSEPATLPRFLNIIEVETQNKSQQEGRVFIDYTDSVLAQEMKIKIMRLDNQARWTLFLDPVSKQLKIIE